MTLYKCALKMAASFIHPQHNAIEMLYGLYRHHHMHIHGWKSAHVWNVNLKSNTVMRLYIRVYVHILEAATTNMTNFIFPWEGEGWPVMKFYQQLWHALGMKSFIAIYRRHSILCGFLHLAVFILYIHSTQKMKFPSKPSNMLPLLRLIPLRALWLRCG